MIEKLAFEYTDKNGDSRCIGISLKDNQYIFKTGSGRNGLYDCACFTRYACPAANLDLLNDQIKLVKIYSWRKGYPIGYIPRRRLMGSDKDTWSLTYKETDKKVYRTIFGTAGNFPPGWFTFISSLSQIAPTEDLKEWLFNEVL